MAGDGQRFLDVGYKFPKPMIDVLGRPMIQRVLENLNLDAQYHFIVKKDHQLKYGICDLLKGIIPDCKIIQIDQKTNGAACSALLAFDNMDSFNESLLITNCDQIFEWNSSKFFNFSNNGYDGTLLCHNDSNSKWSYCIGSTKEDNTMDVSLVVEKPAEIPYPPYANVGLYYWKKALDFYKDANLMIKNQEKIKGEYYIAPVYNKIIQKNGNVGAFLCDKMWGIGTPEDLKKYEIEFNLDKKTI